MSEKKTLVGKAIAAIVELFKENWQSFAAKLFNKVPDDLKEDISVGIRVVELFKKFVDSPTADLITAIIPGDLDDKLKVWLRGFLSEWHNLELFDMKEDAHKLTLATTINKELTGLTFDQTVLTTQIVYNGLKKEGKI